MKAVIALAALAAASPFVIDSIHNDAAPIHSTVDAQAIPDSYIVVFKDHVSPSGAEAHHSWVQDIHLSSLGISTELKKRGQTPMQDTVFKGLKHTYQIDGFLGYSGHFGEDVIEQVRRHPDVAFIEKDSVVHTMEFTVEESGETEGNAPWGLARISHRDALGLGSFNKYVYTADAGEGIDVYVIDTGVNIQHVEFEGRAKWGKTLPDNEVDDDTNGHGTHCAGTIAGSKFGVSKKANIIAVKVLRSNGSGTMADVVKGVEFAAQAHQAEVKKAKDNQRKGFKGSVANMSLGGGKSTALDLAVNAAVDTGLHFAVAAGNDNQDSCRYSPAAADKAITVGASTIGDERAYFSNFGKCNDIFAPGLNILSAWIGSKYATNTISGTSMASPHICGLIAYFLSIQPATDSAYAVADITPKQLKANLIAIGTRNALSDVPSDTTNILAWNGGGSSNYTKIVHDGGYTVRGLVEEVEEKSSKYVSAKVAKLKAKFEADIEAIESEMEKLLDDF